jgi:hypothetical protein
LAGPKNVYSKPVKKRPNLPNGPWNPKKDSAAAGHTTDNS